MVEVWLAYDQTLAERFAPSRASGIEMVEETERGNIEEESNKWVTIAAMYWGILLVARYQNVMDVSKSGGGEKNGPFLPLRNHPIASPKTCPKKERD